MSIAMSDVSELLKYFDGLLDKAPFIQSDFANPECWDENLRSFYLKELDIVDIENRDSSFQYYLIANKNFNSKSHEYASLIENMSEADILSFMDCHEGHTNFNQQLVHDNLKGMKESYRLAFHIVALEYRALIEAIKVNNFSSDIEDKAIKYCHRCLASSFNPNYHQS